MTYLNRKQITDQLRSFAYQRNIAPDLSRKYFMLERVLERLSHSDYRENFIIKGGFLIGSMIGTENRTTKDIDATIRGITLDRENLWAIFNKIFQDSSLDNIHFELVKMDVIRDEEFYPGYRLTVQYNLDGLTDNLKFDLTTGDSIVPEVKKYEHRSMLSEKKIEILAYPIEQVLSEKLHTIIERNILSTRMRDFYDIYILVKIQKSIIDFNALKRSFENTVRQRKTFILPNDYQEVIDALSEDEHMKSLWQNYQSSNSYAKYIDYKDTIQTVQYLLYKIQQLER